VSNSYPPPYFSLHLPTTSTSASTSLTFFVPTSQLRSHYWSNFYATTRGPVLPWPQVVHDSFAGISYVIHDCHVQYFQEESSRGIGYDHRKRDGPIKSGQSVLSSLCSSIDPYMSDRAYIHIPIPHQEGPARRKQTEREMGRTYPSSRHPASLSTSTRPCRNWRKGRDIHAPYQVLYTPVLAAVFANTNEPRIWRSRGSGKGQWKQLNWRTMRRIALPW